MRNSWRTGLAAILAAAAVVGYSATVLASAAPATGGGDHDRGRDVAALKKLGDQQADAWFREDGAAFAATYTTDADLVTFNGDHLRTREGIARGMQFYFDNYIDHTRLHTVDETIRFAGRDLAIIVRTSCQFVPPATTCRPDSLSRNTNVMVKRHGQWLQESFQNTRVVALP